MVMGKTNEESSAARLRDYLMGININNFHERLDVFWVRSKDVAEAIEIQKDYATGSSGDTANERYVFGPASTPPYDAQLLGTFGTDGDELILDGKMIVETCALEVFEYVSVFAPTYVSITSEDDEEKLKDLIDGFCRTGKLPKCFVNPLAIMELKTLLQVEAELGTFVVEGGITRVAITNPFIDHVLGTHKAAARFFAAGFIMSRLINDIGGNLQFDVPNRENLPEFFNSLLLARSAKGYLAMDIESGKVFSLGVDMYRAVVHEVNSAASELLKSEEIPESARKEALGLLQGKLGR